VPRVPESSPRGPRRPRSWVPRYRYGTGAAGYRPGRRGGGRLGFGNADGQNRRGQRVALSAQPAITTIATKIRTHRAAELRVDCPGRGRLPISDLRTTPCLFGFLFARLGLVLLDDLLLNVRRDDVVMRQFHRVAALAPVTDRSCEFTGPLPPTGPGP